MKANSTQMKTMPKPNQSPADLLGKKYKKKGKN
jgi:hypothetical protein